MWLVDADDAMLYAVALLLVHLVLLSVQRLDDQEVFVLVSIKGNMWVGVQ